MRPLLVVMVTLAVVVISILVRVWQVQTVGQDRPICYGRVLEVNADVDSTTCDTVSYNLVVFRHGPDVPSSESGPWVVPVERRSFVQYHPGDPIEFRLPAATSGRVEIVSSP